jgi:hypothetical protein
MVALKAKAMLIVKRAEAESRGWVPAYAEGDQDLWTPKLVKDALVGAFRLLRATAGRVGPGGQKVYWPEFQNHAETDFPSSATRVPISKTREDIRRMEIVLFGWKDADGHDHEAWLPGPLRHVPELRLKLEAWIFAELTEVTTVELCERRKWSRATFKRHRDRAAGMIAQRLNRANLPIW